MGVVASSGVVELHWEMDQEGTVWYHLFTRDGDGQLAVVDSYVQGPFDTCVEVAQWAWKRIALRVPPSRYSRP